jgi:hypothetical protein
MRALPLRPTLPKLNPDTVTYVLPDDGPFVMSPTLLTLITASTMIGPEKTAKEGM